MRRDRPPVRAAVGAAGPVTRRFAWLCAFFGRVAFGVVLALSLPLSSPAEEPAAAPPDYAVWEEVAAGVEDEIEQESISDARLEELRRELAQWRSLLTAAQTANSARIATVKEQIAALGPPPEEGQTEAAEIAARRQELTDLLAKLQAPGLAADEAYRRADGLIREIDRELRERQANHLMQLWPSPVNPTNWTEAAIGFSDTVVRLWDETSTGWATARARNRFLDNLPLFLLLLAAALAAVVVPRRRIEALVERLHGRGSMARQRVIALMTSLVGVIVPFLGLMAFSAAAQLSGLTGDLTGRLARALPMVGLTFLIALWLGRRIFARVDSDDPFLALPPEQRAEGRALAGLLGLAGVAEELRVLVMGPQLYSDAVTSVASFPILVVGGVLLWRTGRILHLARANRAEAHALTVLTLLARISRAVGVVGPVLAALGYVAAARALVFPTALSLGLLAALVVLHGLLTDLWLLISRSGASGPREGLAPVFLGLVLALASLPALALIWGARWADLTEIWERFREGMQLGETRISPSDFVIFAMIFAVGYILTRLVQGVLKTTVLPRTRIEQGGQTALVVGTGYLGILIAALVAINATGIDLSGFAIVISALSVGIGFGLQNVVQNFVAGIILMIERPISEGDWIQAGETHGIVKGISVRSTRIQTFDRNMLIVPNSDLVGGRVTNWTRFGLAGRLSVPVRVSARHDSRHIESILREVAEAQPLVILNPPPIILLDSFDGGALNFIVHTILRDINFYSSVKSDMNHAIAARFAEEGIAFFSGHTTISLDPPADGPRPLPSVGEGPPALHARAESDARGA